MKKHIATILVLISLLCALPAFGADPAYKVGFSPKGQSLQIVLEGIAGARESIFVAAYSYTSKPISEALVAASKRGIKVFLVADEKSNSGKYTAVNFLANQGLPVRLNGNYAIMHHKFMVIDGRHVQLGSFNYSAAAVDRNAENVLFLMDVPGIAGEYLREWRKLWEEGKDVPARY